MLETFEKKWILSEGILTSVNDSLVLLKIVAENILKIAF